MSDLCWKCKDYLRSTGIRPVGPSEHCHHLPREKPKCWCETKEYSTKAGLVRMVDGSNATFNYCPECGRVLD